MTLVRKSAHPRVSQVQCMAQPGVFYYPSSHQDTLEAQMNSETGQVHTQTERHTQLIIRWVGTQSRNRPIGEES